VKDDYLPSSGGIGSEDAEALDALFGIESFDDLLLPDPPHPINWYLLSAEEARQEWSALDEWVNLLRHTYGLPPAIVPPLWHRHPELVWELSALHQHWLGAFDPQQEGSAPLRWHAEFAAARERLRDWVTISGTKIDTDRPTRPTVWPGEQEPATTSETTIVNRVEDFTQFVNDDVAARLNAESVFYAGSE
jgi:hypothetical protein